MFAVIRSGSKQYKVKEGDVIDVELLDIESGQPAVFSEVLLIAKGDTVKVGKPLVSGASVTGDVMGEIKDDKVIAFKYKRRKGYHRTVGHRQKKLRVKVSKITA